MKDIFGGKVKQAYLGQAVFAIIFVAIVMFVCAIIILCVALFEVNLEADARILFLISSGLSLIMAVSFPLGTIHFARRCDKYPRIARLFLQDYYFAKKGIIHSKRRRKHH